MTCYNRSIIPRKNMKIQLKLTMGDGYHDIVLILYSQHKQVNLPLSIK